MKQTAKYTWQGSKKKNIELIELRVILYWTKSRLHKEIRLPHREADPTK